MTISYPLILPSARIKRVNLYTINAVALSRSPWTFITQVQQHPGEAWGAEVTMPLLEEAEARAWEAFLIKLRGQRGTFFLGDPLRETPSGAATGSPLVKGASQTGDVLLTDGWTASITNILKEGDYIQLGNRLHRVLNNVTSDASGNATLDIFPRIRESPADNTVIITNSAQGTFRLAQNVVPVFNVGEEKLFEISFSAVEAI